MSNIMRDLEIRRRTRGEIEQGEFRCALAKYVGAYVYASRMPDDMFGYLCGLSRGVIGRFRRSMGQSSRQSTVDAIWAYVSTDYVSDYALHKDTAHLIRLALDDKIEDVRAIARRMLPKLQAKSPELYGQVYPLMPRVQGSIMRESAG